MTLSEVLKKYNNENFDAIEYRHIKSIDSDDVDVLYGFAAYRNKMLMSVDGNNYHLNDQIIKYELYTNNFKLVNPVFCLKFSVNLI